MTPRTFPYKQPFEGIEENLQFFDFFVIKILTLSSNMLCRTERPIGLAFSFNAFRLQNTLTPGLRALRKIRASPVDVPHFGPLFHFRRHNYGVYEKKGSPVASPEGASLGLSFGTSAISIEVMTLAISPWASLVFFLPITFAFIVNRDEILYDCSTLPHLLTSHSPTPL